MKTAEKDPDVVVVPPDAKVQEKEPIGRKPTPEETAEFKRLAATAGMPVGASPFKRREVVAKADKAARKALKPLTWTEETHWQRGRMAVLEKIPREDRK